jgi:hypothetical protein
MHAVIEGDNLDLAYPPPWRHGLAEANLRAMWRNYRALGYRRLIYANTLSVIHSEAFAEAIEGSVRVTGVLLTATNAVVRERLSLREVGSALETHLNRSRQRAAELEKHCPVWVHRLTTDHESVREVAERVLADSLDLIRVRCSARLPATPLRSPRFVPPQGPAQAAPRRLLPH